MHGGADEARDVLDALSGGVVVLDADARIVRWNAWMEQATGRPAAAVLGRPLAEAFPGTDLKRLPSAVHSALHSSASTILTHALNPGLLPLRTRSGRPLLHHVTVSPVGDGQARGCLLFVSDVTLVIEREQYLRRQQNARYDAVVASAPDLIMTIDDEGLINFANPAAAAHLDFSDAELVGHEAAALFDDTQEWRALWRRVMDEPDGVRSRELVARRKDGSLTHLEVSASRWKTGLRNFVTVILRDVNERRATDAALRRSEEAARRSAAALMELNQTLEERVRARTEQLMKTEEVLRQSQKMEAIGNLTGGIAHDFNNLLHVISGNLQLLRYDVAGNAVAEARVVKALDGVMRSAKLAQQLLAFARRQPLEPRVINLGQFIRDMEDMLRKAVGEGVTVKLSLDEGLWNTLIDPGNVENALLNLAINARDAMSGQGQLDIEARNVVLDAEYTLAHEGVLAGEYVLVSVTDTGEGMTPEVIEQAFEPFFTTKAAGRGTGLGLSMVYGFVKQSGGHIRIQSGEGRGTTICLYLPRSMRSEEPLSQADATPVIGGSEMVLVAEDDETVRETVVAMLNDLGYRVLKAKDAQSALTIIESGMPIDLLFTDVVMPGPMRSAELARKAKERMPGLAVLFTSGYARAEFQDEGRPGEKVEMLSKPYSQEALARKLRAVLDGATQPKGSVARAGVREPAGETQDVK